MSPIGLLPAAGRGVRAYPYTATVPKSMLEIDGVPNLQRNVELLRDQLGVRDVRIVVGHQGEVIKRHFEDGRRFGVAVTYVDNPRVDLELPYSVYLAGRAIDQPCVMLLADECYVGSNHAALLAGADPDARVVFGQIAAEYAKQIRKNYVFELRDGRIVDLLEKPAHAAGRLMGVGTYLLRPEIFRRLEAAFAGGPESGPKDWTTWLASLARAGVPMATFELQGRYVNINSRDDLNTANYLVRDHAFERKRRSFVFVVDGDAEAAARGVARYAEEADVDELVVAARTPAPALARVATGGRVRLVTADDPGATIATLVKLGLDHASGDILLLANSDDTFAPRDVGKFLVYLRDADMVVGTRTTRQMIEQGNNMRGIVRYAHIVLAKILQLLWWHLECRFSDIGCVYRALWRSTYQQIRDSLQEPGVEIFAEMVIEVLRARRRIIEIPINYYSRDLEYLRVHGRYQTVGTFVRVLGLLIRRRLADRGVWE
ncbi:MAG TPA: sugar phosphate nucleotidyltransferase [Candidatus Dormibacteraeota bacterium]|nr:sugar phosphate nucleotidyltransferase [Candidatus Dormibacteraeota bacterium]